MKKMLLSALLVVSSCIMNAQNVPEVLGQKTTLTIGEVFDFEIGDEFHFRTSIGPGNVNQTNSPNAKRYIIVGKTFSPGLDTVCYLEKHSDYITQPVIPLVYQYNFYTSKVCYTDLDSLVQTLVPIDTAFQIFPYFFSSLKPDFQFCDSLVFNYQFGFNARQLEESYGKGLGHVFFADLDMGSMPGFYHSYYLFYFNKGGSPCGTPDNTTMDIDEETTRSGNWIVYPNPVSQTLRLLSREMCASKVRFVLTDLSGRIVTDLMLDAGMQFWTVDVSGLMAGNYLGRIVMNDGSTQIVKVLKQ